MFLCVVDSSPHGCVCLLLQEQKATGGGGNLMDDLHAKLSMRRKVWTVLLCMEFHLHHGWDES